MILIDKIKRKEALNLIINYLRKIQNYSNKLEYSYQKRVKKMNFKLSYFKNKKINNE